VSASLAPLLDALRFLTILPLPGASGTSERGMAAAIPWFPVVGGLLGLLLLPVGWLAGLAWNETVRAACIVVAGGMLTAGLHLDGLSDTFDAVMSWRSRERKLEIMRDSSIGVMGALALAAVLLLKVAWLQAAGADWWQAVLLAPVWGRWASMYGLASFPAARPGGLGHSFRQQMGQQALLLPTAGVLLFSLLLCSWQGVAAGLLVWGSTHLLARWWTRALGGLTGDTYGALTEIGEVVALAALSV
jgi:adenosylcobinamide-GDP ribazoletransferase